MRTLMFLCVGVALLGFASAGFSYPTLLGPTGTGVLPTAEVACPGQFNLALDYYDTKDNDLGLDNTIPARFNWGFSKWWEIGAGYTFSQLNEEDVNTWNVNLKYQFPSKALGFDWAIGGLYGQTTNDAFVLLDDNITNGQVYLVGDIAFSELSKATIGVNWTQIDAGDILGTNDAFRLFRGATIGFSDSFELVGDIQSDSEDVGDLDPLYSAAARWYVSDTIGLQAGWTNARYNGLVGDGDGNWFAGVNFAFGGGQCNGEECEQPTSCEPAACPPVGTSCPEPEPVCPEACPAPEPVCPHTPTCPTNTCPSNKGGVLSPPESYGY